MVDGGSIEVDGLSAKGTVGCPKPDIIEALPAHCVLIRADDRWKFPVSIVLDCADSALFGFFFE